MKLSEFKDEEALDLLAEIIDPVTEIMSDDEVKKASEKGIQSVVKAIIKNHKKSIIAVMAALDGVDVKDYHFNVLTLPIKILEMLNDKELVDFFQFQVQMISESHSGNAMENTEVAKK